MRIWRFSFVCISIFSFHVWHFQRILFLIGVCLFESLRQRRAYNSYCFRFHVWAFAHAGMVLTGFCRANLQFAKHFFFIFERFIVFVFCILCCASRRRVWKCMVFLRFACGRYCRGQWWWRIIFRESMALANIYLVFISEYSMPWLSRDWRALRLSQSFSHVTSFFRDLNKFSVDVFS